MKNEEGKMEEKMWKKDDKEGYRKWGERKKESKLNYFPSRKVEIFLEWKKGRKKWNGVKVKKNGEGEVKW